MPISMESLEFDLLIIFAKSDILSPNFIVEGHSYFSKAELGQLRSTSATSDGSIDLNVRPVGPASKYASSTIVIIADDTDFHISGDLLTAVNCNSVRDSDIIFSLF